MVSKIMSIEMARAAMYRAERAQYHAGQMSVLASVEYVLDALNYPDPSDKEDLIRHMRTMLSEIRKEMDR